MKALDDDQIVAQDAVKGLGRLGGDSVVETLLGVASRHARSSVRDAAARELRAWPTEDVVEALLRLLNSECRPASAPRREYHWGDTPPWARTWLDKNPGSEGEPAA